MTGPLEQIAAQNPDARGAELARAERVEFERRMRDQAALARARKAVMHKTREITGRVIFPGRWTAKEEWDRTYGRCYRCTTRWHGLRLVATFHPGRDESPWTRLTVEGPPELTPKAVTVKSAAELATALREWGLVK